MNFLMFYLGAFVLLCLGALFLRNTSARGRMGGAEFEARRKRRMIGNILIAAAAVSLTTGIITQVFSENVTPADPLALSTPAFPTSTSPAAASLLQGFQLATNPASPAYPPSSSTSAVLPDVSPVTATALQGFQLATNSATSSTPLAISDADMPSGPTTIDLFAKAAYFMEQKRYEDALQQVNDAVQADPQNPAAYSLRGDINAAMRRWDWAESDYQTALLLDGTNDKLKFNLAEVEFVQQKYDAARAHFASLEQDSFLGDLAQYHVFLCDLLGGHQATAAKELDVFNEVGSNASYYFANAAWSLYHQKKDDAQDWLASASRIYSPTKYKLYADSLIRLGSP